MTEPSEVRRPHVEKLLDERIPNEWTFDPAVPLGYIDAEASLRRRIGGPREPDEEMVARYAAAMNAGANFPPIICVGEPRAGGLLIVDGLRIYLAAQAAARVHLPAYIAPRAALDRLMAW